VDLASLTMTLELGVGEDLTCTLELVETRAATSRMIADFLGARNSQILANQPSFSRRWSRLNGGQSGASSLTTSLLGFSHRFDFPFQAALSEGEASFAASLSGFSGGDLAGSDVGSWDVWSEGRVGRFDDSSSDNGLFAIVHGGVDYRMGQDVLVGVAVSVDWTSQDNATNAGHIFGTGWMAGPYALIRLDEAIYVDARASWGQSSNTISPFGTYTDTFDTTRWLVAGAISGDYRHGGWTLNPVVSLQYIEERQEAYVDSLSVTIPGQTVAQGDVRFEPRLAYSWQTLGGTQVTPWMQLAGVYTFGQRGTFSSGSLVSRMSGLTSTVRTGFDISMPGGAALSVSGQISGIGSGAQSHGGSLAVSLPLH
jgi:outer membrane autotransporter protein